MTVKEQGATRRARPSEQPGFRPPRPANDNRSGGVRGFNPPPRPANDAPPFRGKPFTPIPFGRGGAAGVIWRAGRGTPLGNVIDTFNGIDAFGDGFASGPNANWTPSPIPPSGKYMILVHGPHPSTAYAPAYWNKGAVQSRSAYFNETNDGHIAGQYIANPKIAVGSALASPSNTTQGYWYPNDNGVVSYAQKAAFRVVTTKPAIDAQQGLDAALGGKSKVYPDIDVGINPNTLRALPSLPNADPNIDPNIDPGVQPAPGPSPSPNPIPIRGISVNTGPNPGIGPAPVSPRVPPPPRVRERKEITRSTRIAAAIFRGLDNLSEAAEVVDSAYEALPDSVKDNWDCNRRAPFIDNAGQYGIDNADCKLAALWHNWDKMDANQFVENLIKNAIEDKIHGSIHGALPPNTINAFEDAFKEGGQALDDFLDWLMDQL